MIVLGIDTSGISGGVALVTESSVVSEYPGRQEEVLRALDGCSRLYAERVGA